jgi:hypothetical protein
LKIGRIDQAQKDFTIKKLVEGRSDRLFTLWLMFVLGEVILKPSFDQENLKAMEVACSGH